MKTFSTPGDIYNTTPSRILFGPGKLSAISEEVAHLGAKRALVVSTPGRSAMAEGVVKRLENRCVGIWPEAISQVPIELAQRGRMVARELDADCLVSVGGGASIGFGKAIALELRIPVIAVPTTYSGSEMTGFCGITIDGIKRMHASLNMLASSVIYDPLLSVSLPTDVSAASAMNALAHCIDTVVVSTCSPIMAMAAAEGARQITAGLPALMRDPSDTEARARVLYGAYLGGSALTGGFALQHGVAHVLGGSFGVSHGLAHALVLPHVAAHHARTVPHLMAPVAEAMGVPTHELGAAVFDLLAGLNLPVSLKEIGFDPAGLDRAASIVLETDHGANPVPLTFDAVRGLLDDTFHGRRPL